MELVPIEQYVEGVQVSATLWSCCRSAFLDTLSLYIRAGSLRTRMDTLARLGS